MSFFHSLPFGFEMFMEYARTNSRQWPFADRMPPGSVMLGVGRCRLILSRKVA
jgi:hypothetical protein